MSFAVFFLLDVCLDAFIATSNRPSDVTFPATSIGESANSRELCIFGESSKSVPSEKIGHTSGIICLNQMIIIKLFCKFLTNYYIIVIVCSSPFQSGRKLEFSEP